MKKLLFIGILLMGLSLQGWTQEKTITVTGIVTDTEKEPLIGVNISVQNMPGLGVITDINGRYRISVPAYNRLVFSYVGYETANVLIKEQTVVDGTAFKASTSTFVTAPVTAIFFCAPNPVTTTSSITVEAASFMVTFTTVCSLINTFAVS